MGTHKLAAGPWTSTARALRRLRSAVDSVTSHRSARLQQRELQAKHCRHEGFSERRTLP
jgi:hypothetical protein